MSRNNKIRRSSEDLPPYPKFTADGKIIPGTQADHFKIINTLRKEANGDRLVMDYMKKVRSYDLKRRGRRLKRTVITGLFILIIAGLFVYFKLNYAEIK